MEQYRQVFIEEAREHIEILKNPKNVDALNKIFRSAHTLKSSSAMMGFKDISDLAHTMEDVFDDLRKGGQVSSDLIDVLLDCVDALAARLNNIENKIDEEIEVTKFVERLREVSKTVESAVLERKEMPPEEHYPKEDRISFDENEKNKIMDTLENGGKCFLVHVKFTDDCAFKSIRANMVLDNLADKGEVVKTVPSRHEIGEEKIGSEFKIVLASRFGEKEIEDCLKAVSEVDKVHVVPIDTNFFEGKEFVSKVQTTRKSKPTVDIRSAQIVRVHFDQLDKLMNLAGELVINKAALLELTSDIKRHALKRVTQNIDRLTADLQDLVTQIRMVPVSQIFDRFPRLVRDLSKKVGKKIDLVLEGREIEVDRTVLDQIGEPLVHLIRNSVDHGIEPPDERRRRGKNPTGKIRLTAQRKGDHVIIEIEDDGAGIDPEKVKKSAIEKGFISEVEAEKMSKEQLTNLIFLPGMSTAKEVTETSGRGVGMDVVKSKITNLRGKIDLETQVGVGTKVTLKIPLTLAIIKALIVKDSNQTFAIPTTQVSEIVLVNREKVKPLGGLKATVVRGRLLPLLHLHNLLNLQGGEEPEQLEVLVIHGSNKDEEFGLVVDSVVRQQEIMIKPLDEALADIKGLSGVTILGDGQVVLVLEPAEFISRDLKLS